jgi:hypothetical protein
VRKFFLVFGFLVWAGLGWFGAFFFNESVFPSTCVLCFCVLCFMEFPFNWCEVATRELCGKERTISPNTFCRIFGFEPPTVQAVYFLYFLGSEFKNPKYLLWVLSFLKNYERDSVAPLKFRKCNPRTYRDSVWRVLNFLYEEMDEVFFFLMWGVGSNPTFFLFFFFFFFLFFDLGVEKTPKKSEKIYTGAPDPL